jgi:hypothetical protein
MTQSCQIKQRYTFHLHPVFIEVSNIILKVYMYAIFSEVESTTVQRKYANMHHFQK